jgi:regulatory protein
MHTEKQLFDAISRKAREKFEDITEPQVRALADIAVAFGHETKALDDTVFAEISTRAGLRRGKSKRAIAQNLSQKGVSKTTAETATAGADDLFAAVVLARKRRFGPFRNPLLDDALRDKVLSTLMRAGFSFDIGKRILDMSLEEADEVLDQARYL